MVDIIVPVALFAMVAVIAIGMPLAKAWARRLDKQPVLPPGGMGTAEVLGRLERIEQALEVMSTEVERITEGQRFVTRLLSESRQPVAVNAPAAMPTALPAASASPAPTPPSSTPPSRPDDGTVLSDAARRS